MNGGINFYQYCSNLVSWIDPLGLSPLTNTGTESIVDFYVGPAGPSATLPATGYRYMRYLNNDGTLNKRSSSVLQEMKDFVSYFGFKKFNSVTEARNAFQISTEWSDARLLGEFDTLQLFENGIPKVRVPFWAGDTVKGKLEPFAEAYPEFGLGGVQQLHADGLIIYFKKVTILKE